MDDKSIPQHFLDTSVLRSLLLGTQVYKQYFESQFTDQPLYISNYVQMEMRRSYLINLISFYFVLRLETINNIGDAIALWSNRFKTSELKAILQLIPQLFSTHQLNFSSPQDKEKAISILGIYIKRFELLLRKKFNNTNTDSTTCTRALVPLTLDLQNLAAGLKQFADEFGDVKNCRSKCQIDQFLLVQYRAEIEQLIQIAAQLPKNSNTRGFINIANNLKEILAQGATACDCKRCEKIGDAVIALNAPRNMQLEHTDNSFDYLCPTINQPHYKHPSESKIFAR
ncbi:hypothetical protein [Anabaena catenula]|uniref:Uncharacterized protein n=1 Tax=Anabaena catenula FACHB-362 TaxID=2692877 RepID=A0ABR8J9J6_9NOST|nr:hypothetical protein [Anabaena catenula]MBD2694152.1 hypothetical protein [Anabaena catenula FACHB-362]